MKPQTRKLRVQTVNTLVQTPNHWSNEIADPNSEIPGSVNKIPGSDSKNHRKENITSQVQINYEELTDDKYYLVLMRILNLHRLNKESGLKNADVTEDDIHRRNIVFRSLFSILLISNDYQISLTF